MRSETQEVHARFARASRRRQATARLQATVVPPFDDDASAVAAQIGREPRGTWKVARRCECGLPQVIETYPQLKDGTPFPTRWWLTCKKLVAETARLEADGFTATVNDRLRSDEVMRSNLETSTRAYVDARDQIQPLGKSGHPGGGDVRVKCLHAHLAHHLITDDNPVGEAVLRELSWIDPTTPCV